MKSVVITEAALSTACHPEFPVDALFTGNPPDNFANIIFRSGDASVLVSTSTCKNDSRLLIIAGDALKGFAHLQPEDHAGFFDRCVRFGLRGFDKSIALSPNAMPYREGSRSSVYASSNSTLRIVADENYLSSRNIYIFDLRQASDVQKLSGLEPDITAYDNAIADANKLIAQAILSSSQTGDAIELDWQGSDSVAKGFAFEEWLPLLSTDQRKFVEREVTGPLRVRGAAGTGKTLAMVMKALKLAKDSGEDPSRILFLTHSWAIAGQIDGMINSIGRDIPAASLIEVYPLMEIARQRDYGLVGRRSLGLDSESGKRQAMDVISEIVDAFLISDWIAYRGGCSKDFVSRIEAEPTSKDRRNFVWDLLLEFGCVLAADGLQGRSADREKYLRVRRVGYMMKLENTTEKQIVFQLWSMFLSHLHEHGFISTDQIISDYLNELQTFYWEAKRRKDGYDYIFVDEMHLFNAQERLVFHNLLTDGDAIPKVIMALDPRQSPREVFTEISDDKDQKNRSIYERAQLSNPIKIDFVETYRYTEEIAELTRTVLDSVPALDMNDDWDLPGSRSVTGHGPRPQYNVVTDINAIFTTAITSAKKLQSEARSNGGQVAILCMDYDRFSRLHPAAKGQNPKDIFVIASRDDVERLRFMNQRIIFSTPEYVAGLQFDTVIIVDANANLIPEGAFRGSAERRFLSELYLGISRAQRRLLILASQDADGLTPYLITQTKTGLLEKLV
jgi:hypothetical protein